MVGVIVRVLVAVALAVLPALAVAGASAAPAEEPELLAEGPLRFVPGRGSVLRVDGTGYRGTIEVEARRDGLFVVDHVGLEDYVKGVTEIPDNWPKAALQAQAIAARTYAARYVAEHDRPAGPGDADICGTQACQVYRGLTSEDAGDRRRWVDAVDATRGMILTSGSRPVLARYHSVSGGRTADNFDVFGERLPYLREVRSSGEEDAPLYRWTARFTLEDLGRILGAAGVALEGTPTGARFEDTAAGDGPDLVVVSTGATATPFAARAFAADVNEWAPRLLPDRYPGNDAAGRRMPLTLPSSRFRVDVDPADGKVTLRGRGFGHGVGMPQYGARALARRGWSARRILAHYYGGLEPVTVEEPERIRVSIRTDVSSAAIGATGEFRIEDAAGSPVVPNALSTWRMTPDGGRVLKLTGPSGAARQLAVTGFTAPLQAESGKPIPVEFVLSKPAKVRVLLSGGRAVASPGVLDAGMHRVKIPGTRPGSYTVRVEADDGDRRIRSRGLGVDVEKAVAGPSAPGLLGAVVVGAVLLVGSLRARRRRRKNNPR